MKLITFFLILVINLFANSITEDIVEKIDKAKKDKFYSLFVEAGVVKTFKSYSGDYAVENYTHGLFLATVGAKLFPNTLRLNLSYTVTIDDTIIDGNSYDDARGERYDSVQYIDIYLKPFVTKYGDLGFGYKNYKYNSMVENVLNEPISVPDVQNDGINPSGYLDDKSIFLNIGEKYSIKNRLKRYSLTYNFPKFKYLPTGSGFKYAVEKITKPHVLREAVAVKMNLEGVRFGLGIYKTYDELKKDGFFIKTFELYRIKYRLKDSGTKIYIIDFEDAHKATLADLDTESRFYGFLIEGIYQKTIDNKKYYTSLSLDYFKTTWSDKDEDDNGNILPVKDYAKEYTFLLGIKIGMEF